MRCPMLSHVVVALPTQPLALFLRDCPSPGGYKGRDLENGKGHGENGLIRKLSLVVAARDLISRQNGLVQPLLTRKYLVTPCSI
jgi:hypothetical protein